MDTTLVIATGIARSRVEELQKNRRSITEEERDEVITMATNGANAAVKAIADAPTITEEQVKILKRQIESWATIHVDDSTALTSAESRQRKPWIDDAGMPLNRSDFRYRYYSRYEQYLKSTKGWPVGVVDNLGKESAKILGHLGDPKDTKPWQRRGMVVGYVQSGKTANFTGVINRAIDTGYKVVIVLTGMIEDLRQQTQGRLDAEIVGFDSALRGTGSTRVGVGLTTSQKDLRGIRTMTSAGPGGDFRSDAVRFAPHDIEGENVFLFVVKKNVTVLKKLNEWLRTSALNVGGMTDKLSMPALVIDDECDQASINTKKNSDIARETDITAINEQIRRILNRFDRSSYVGYTATPFANIFIDPNAHDAADDAGQDLFPRDFIVMLKASQEYVGANAFFGFDDDHDAGIEGEPGMPVVRDASDAYDYFPPRHKKDLIVDDLPESLKDAIVAYLLMVGVRALRGDGGAHSTMLVHVSRLVAVQLQTAELIQNFCQQVQRAIRYEGPTSGGEIWDRVSRIFKDEILDESTRYLADETRGQVPDSLEDFLSTLRVAAEQVYVKCINGATKEKLDYHQDEASHVIAVGGDILSRGLTMEGLTISYFIRQSKMYDSLMQMGRWFGYRPGYRDLCRLWTTSGIRFSYRHIALASEELRRDFETMARAKATPKQFGLRVRTDPTSTLIVTSRNKLQRTKTYPMTLAGRLLQTLAFAADPSVHRRNFSQAVEPLISMLEATGARKPTHRKAHVAHVFENVAAADVIAFMNSYSASLENPLDAHPDLIRDYIRKKNEQGELLTWTVALPCNGSSPNEYMVAGLQVNPAKRTAYLTGDDPETLRIGVLTSPTYESIDLSPDQEKSLPPNKKSHQIRTLRSPANGLLVLWPLDPQTSELATARGSTDRKTGWPPLAEVDSGVWAFSVSTPTSSDPDGCVHYVGNVVFQKNLEAEWQREQEDETDEWDGF